MTLGLQQRGSEKREGHGVACSDSLSCGMSFMSADGCLLFFSISNHNKLHWPEAAGMQTLPRSQYLQVCAAVFAVRSLPAPQKMQGAMQVPETLLKYL